MTVYHKLHIKSSILSGNAKNRHISKHKKVRKSARLKCKKMITLKDPLCQSLFRQKSKIKKPGFPGFFVFGFYQNKNGQKGSFLSQFLYSGRANNMKKLFIIICAFFVGFAHADNVITSKEYVDTQGAALQPQVPAKNTNTVLTYPAAGTDAPGEKAIYDASAAYATQSDALVTAGQFNNALQVALDTEFVCVSRNDQGCLLYEIRSASQKQTLPAGYTQLEYIESTGTQYIDTDTLLNASSKFEFKFMTDAQRNYAVFGASNGAAYDRGEIALFYYQYREGRSVIEAVRPYDNTHSEVVVPRPGITADTAYTVSYDKNELVVNGASQPSNWYTGYVGNRPAYLFASNRGATSWIGGNTKIYYFKIYNNNELIRNFIPVRRDSDNVLGMYDLVSGAFFTNAGTGEFIAGPVFSYLPQGNQ